MSYITGMYRAGSACAEPSNSQRFFFRSSDALTAFLLPLLLLATTLRSPVHAQQNISLATPECVLGQQDPLHQIRGVALQENQAVVLTSPSPAIHVYAIDSCRNEHRWGREGQGPGELENAVDITFFKDSIAVLDLIPGNSRVTIFSITGEVGDLSTISDFTIVDRIEAAGSKLIVEGREFNQRQRTVATLGNTTSALLQYTTPESIRFRSQNGPMRNLAIDPPFASSPAWAALGDSVLAYWDGARDLVELLSANGRLLDTLKLPAAQIAVTEADQEAWIQKHFSPEAELFGVRDPYREFRDDARDSVDFPDLFAPVLGMKADVVDGIWVLRAEGVNGQVWSLIRSEGERARISLPAGRELAAVGLTHLATSAVDELGVELVELYRWRRITN